MPGIHIVQRKIVADSTTVSWAQAYHAGNLFIAVSLTTPENGPDPVSAIGKELINNIEAEFFSLEKKDLPSIKQAVITSLTIIPKKITLSFALCYLYETVLYGIVSHEGHILLKRQDSLGIILAQAKNEQDQLVSASGYLKPGDVILLETATFSHLFTQKEIKHALLGTTLDDIVDEMSGKIQTPGSDGAAAIIVEYKSEEHPPFTEPTYATSDATSDVQDVLKEHNPSLEVTDDSPPKREEELEVLRETKTTEKNSFLVSLSQTVQKFLPHKRIMLSNKRKVALSIVVILVIILVGSIFLTITSNEAAQKKQAFQSAYTQAQSAYADGQGINVLNPQGAQDDYQKAKKILTDALPQFQTGSVEEKQLSTLLQKVERDIHNTNDTLLSAKETTDGSPTLLLERDNNNVLAVTIDDTGIYTVTPKAVISKDLGNGKEKTIIKNASDWENAVSIGTFLGNVYLLDPKNGLLKYVAASDGFGKTTYFKSNVSDLSKALSLSIDGSVYILFSDGNIKKYTKGVTDDFTLSSITPGLSKATKLFTTIDSTSLYVLDPANSRVVKLDKKGALQAQYASDVLKNAKDFTVSEKDKKLYVLNNNKVFVINLP